MWRQGPHLPTSTFAPGEFVSHGQTLLYAGGMETGAGNQIHQLNGNNDGWVFVSKLHDMNVSNKDSINQLITKCQSVRGIAIVCVVRCD